MSSSSAEKGHNGARFAQQGASRLFASPPRCVGVAQACGQVRGGSTGFFDVTAFPGKHRLKQGDGISLRCLAQIIPGKYLFGKSNHILDKPLPEVIGERDPINLHLSIPSKKRRSQRVLRALC